MERSLQGNVAWAAAGHVERVTGPDPPRLHLGRLSPAQAGLWVCLTQVSCLVPSSDGPVPESPSDTWPLHLHAVAPSLAPRVTRDLFLLIPCWPPLPLPLAHLATALSHLSCPVPIIGGQSALPCPGVPGPQTCGSVWSLPRPAWILTVPPVYVNSHLGPALILSPIVLAPVSVRLGFDLSILVSGSPLPLPAHLAAPRVQCPTSTCPAGLSPHSLLRGPLTCSPEDFPGPGTAALATLRVWRLLAKALLSAGSRGGRPGGAGDRAQGHWHEASSPVLPTAPPLSSWPLALADEPWGALGQGSKPRPSACPWPDVWVPPGAGGPHSSAPAHPLNLSPHPTFSPVSCVGSPYLRWPWVPGRGDGWRRRGSRRGPAH